jgi:hypothetical protein
MVTPAWGSEIQGDVGLFYVRGSLPGFTRAARTTELGTRVERERDGLVVRLPAGDR